MAFPCRSRCPQKATPSPSTAGTKSSRQKRRRSTVLPLDCRRNAVCGSSIVGSHCTNGPLRLCRTVIGAREHHGLSVLPVLAVPTHLVPPEPRSRRRPRQVAEMATGPLTASVDMTSVVKRAILLGVQGTDHIIFSFFSAQQQSRSQQCRRWITLISVGWLPPYLCPSGACLGSRHEDFLQPHNVQRGLRHTGAAKLRRRRACE